jgi:diguanylate cyclase (GGDEF)-like protein
VTAITLTAQHGSERESPRRHVPIPLRRRNDLPPDPPAEAITVLIVEDDENFSVWLSSITRRLGLTVVTAANGVEALKKLASTHCDLLISDFEMPRKDGLALIADVRANPETSGMYAVMLTAHDELSVKVTALTLGYDDFLAKGCTEVEVVAKVAAARRILARQHALDANARQWRDIANHDELTRVATRRFFFEQAERHLEQKDDIAVVLFDVNDFKSINDDYGHLMGDRVLKDMGALFLRRTRSDDVIARYGGDEFVLLALKLTVEETRAVAERLAAELSSLQWHERGALLQLGVTIGMGCSSLIPGATIEQLLEVADRELYANKWLKKHPATTPPEAYEYPEGAAAVPPAAPRRIVS